MTEQPLYRKCRACDGCGRVPLGEDTQGRQCFACKGVGYVEVGCTLNRLLELLDLSHIWYDADGHAHRLASADEVVRRRKEAAVELAALKRAAATGTVLP